MTDRLLHRLTSLHRRLAGDWRHLLAASLLSLMGLLVLSDASWAQGPGGLGSVDPTDAAGGAAPDTTPEATGGPSWIMYLLLIAAGIAIAFGIRLILRQASNSLLYLGSFALIFAGERLWPDSTARWALTGLGVIGLGAMIYVRIRSRADEGDANRQRAQNQALIWSLVGAAALIPYGLTTDAVMDSLALSDRAATRWEVTWAALVPVVWVVGTLPMLFADRVLVQHPVMLPRTVANEAARTGLATALGLALLFPLNYLATHYEWQYDAAYFKTTEPGTSTLALVRELPEPVTAYLFFAAGSDVKEELLPYFETLADSGGDVFRVEVVDQALRPTLSEELKVRDNGYVALVRGDDVEKFKIGTDLDRAERKLKTLDKTVNEHLLALAKGQRVAYLLTGHGEANPRERDNDLRKLNLFKQLLDAQNFKVENFGTTEGSADAVPDDASVVIVASPQKSLLPEEVETLATYTQGGGSLLILHDPGGDPMTGLLEPLGLSVGDQPLAHASAHIRQTRGNADRILLVTNRFGSHESVTTLSRNSTQLAVVTPTVAAITKADDAPGRVTTLIRSLPDTWVELDGDMVRDEGESARVWDLAVASEGPEDTPWRAIVVGDVNVFSDPVLQYSQGNAVFGTDALRWLVGEESLMGETESEEDVRIQHTRDEDVVWFWSTIFAVPVLILVAGFVFVRIRRSS